MTKLDPTRGVGWGAGWQPPQRAAPEPTKLSAAERAQKGAAGTDMTQRNEKSEAKPDGGWRNPDLDD